MSPTFFQDNRNMLDSLDSKYFGPTLNDNNSTETNTESPISFPKHSTNHENLKIFLILLLTIGLLLLFILFIIRIRSIITLDKSTYADSNYEYPTGNFGHHRFGSDHSPDQSSLYSFWLMHRQQYASTANTNSHQIDIDRFLNELIITQWMGNVYNDLLFANNSHRASSSSPSASDHSRDQSLSKSMVPDQYDQPPPDYSEVITTFPNVDCSKVTEVPPPTYQQIKHNSPTG